MTHFLVTVQIEDKIMDKLGTEQAVTDALAPFIEELSNPEDKPYFNWVDESGDMRDKWDNEAVDLVRLPDDKTFNGRIVFPFDREFGFIQKKDSLLTRDCAEHERNRWENANFIGTSVTHMFPVGSEFFTGKFSDLYPDFETYVKEYGGFDPDKIGYWTNPNAKWDWYQIGGRFEGSFQNKTGTEVDVVQIKDLYIDEPDARDKAGEFYDRFIIGIQAGTYDSNANWGDGSISYGLGLRNLEAEKKAREESEDNKWDFVLADDLPNRKDFIEKAWPQWVNCRGYAVLDTKGEWHSPGEMGWWASSTETPEERQEYLDSYLDKHILSLDPDTWLVAVDCHI